MPSIFSPKRFLDPMGSAKGAIGMALLICVIPAAQADCLTRVEEFAKSICGEIEKSGKQVTVDTGGKLSGEIGGIVRRIVGGAGGEIEGKKLVDSYEGVLRKDLAGDRFSARECRAKMVPVAQKEACTKKVAYKTCRHPDFGIAGWNNSLEQSGNSGWRGGGTGQPDWCRELANGTISSRSIGPVHKTETVKSGEDARWVPVRQREYNYECTIKVHWNPIYNERTDPRCGVVGQ